nr:receptor-like protein EIX2 [Quercus suber]
MGKLPHQLILPNVNFIDLSYNCFKGPIPLWFTNVTELYLKSNSFSGTIPSNIDDLMPRLRCLDLSENNLNGTIPLSVWKIKDLGGLYLRSNKLSGGLPDQWNETQPLWVVDISYNLSGKIPSSMGFLCSLHVLVLSNNNLYGEIPSSLQDCPLWCNLPALHILDLAQNNLFGRLPKCLGNFTALIFGNGIIWPSFYVNYVEKAIIVTKGRELEYGSTLQFVTCIDLSWNNLIGEIPDEIISLTALNTLNLSRNHLTENVPKNIGNMRFLETLDLPKNSLSGPIPESMSSLTSLAHLNLSFNKLVGRIPSGYQLQTLIDASIYKGNPQLCGLPFPTKCPGDKTSDGPTFSDGSGSAEDKQDGDGIERLWFNVSIGLGFVVGFWSVCGTLLVKKSWRYWCFSFCDDIKNRIALIIALKIVHLTRKFGLENN